MLVSSSIRNPWLLKNRPFPSSATFLLSQAAFSVSKSTVLFFTLSGFFFFLFGHLNHLCVRQFRILPSPSTFVQRFRNKPPRRSMSFLFFLLKVSYNATILVDLSLNTLFRFVAVSMIAPPKRWPFRRKTKKKRCPQNDYTCGVARAFISINHQPPP
jgi:hypothetical protein